MSVERLEALLNPGRRPCRLTSRDCLDSAALTVGAHGGGPVQQFTHNRGGRDGWIRQAMTLIELLIVLAILGILAALVYPMMNNSTDLARTEAAASNVNQIRNFILHHAGLHDVPLSPGGYPAAISGNWFQSGELPNHSWTERPMIIEVVTAADDVVFPAVKTYNPTVAGDPNCWYNATNGSFCVRVPPMASDALTLETFNEANKVGAHNLAQTTQ